LASIYCAAQIPKDGYSIFLPTRSADGEYNSVGFRYPETIDALGVRMLYESHDLDPALTTSANDTIIIPTESPSAGTGEGSSGGRSTALIATISVSAVLGFLLLLALGFFLFYLRRQQQRKRQRQLASSDGVGLGVVTKPELHGTPAPRPATLARGREGVAELDGREMQPQTPG
jgi:hypothetical protein